MKKRVLGEILNAYADNLLAGDGTAGKYLSRHPDDTGILGDLLRLTEEIAALLTPVSPAPGFIRRLDQRLSAPAEIIIARPSRNKLWLGALAGSLVSAVGVLLVVWMRRGRSSVVAAQ
jgi:hypothetical protein